VQYASAGILYDLSCAILAVSTVASYRERTARLLGRNSLQMAGTGQERGLLRLCMIRACQQSMLED